MSTNWQRRGEGVVNAGMDFVTGVGNAFKGLGSRIKRGKYTNFIETFCAVSGDVASRNGRFMTEEVAGLKKFLRDNHDDPVFGSFASEELIAKLKDYAVAAFLGDDEKILRALRGVEPGSDEAKLVMIGAMAIAFGDGECDRNEADALLDYSTRLGVDLKQLASEYHLSLPNLGLDATPRLTGSTVPALQAPSSSSPDTTLQPLCKRCYAFLAAGNSRCDYCSRDLTHDYAVTGR